MKYYWMLLLAMTLLLLTSGKCTSSADDDTPRRPEAILTFAWLSDVHLGAYASAEDDLRQSIEDINANPDIAFTILSGDVTEFGDTKEFNLLYEVLQTFDKPYLLLPGNHDVNWSENGCTMFNKIFSASHFCHDQVGVRFVGCGAGPSLRMGPPSIPREEVLWLDSVLTATPKGMPVIFVNHFPLDKELSNWYEVTDLLHTRNVLAALAGHHHVNRAYDAEGIPAVIGRSSLRRKDPIGGYNLVTVTPDSITFSERIIKKETLPAWHTIRLGEQAPADTVYERPDYSVNKEYSHLVRSVWKKKDVTDIASQGTSDGSLYVYTNTLGKVYALDANTGDERWNFATGNKTFSTPHITADRVIVSSCDGYLYALDQKTGTVCWKYDTGYPIVACPVVADDAVYIGSGNGRFYSFNLADGSLNWMTEGLKGYIEARPAVDEERVYIGTWGAMFYAFDRKTGRKVWEFDTGRSRYFSPGACWPEVVNGQVIVQSSDYFVRAFNPTDGRILWQSDAAKGRESIGFSPDKKTLYIKGIDEHIHAIDISRGKYQPKWCLPMPYKSNFVPTRLENTEEFVFVPTEFGVVHAIGLTSRLPAEVAWSYKVSHSSVTSLQSVGQERVIVMTMDGTVECLDYDFPKSVALRD